MENPSAQQRSAFRGNLSAALSPKFDLGFNAGFTKQDSRIPPESDLIIALYYVGMQNYGYKGCPGGVAPCGLDKNPTQADGIPSTTRCSSRPVTSCRSRSSRACSGSRAAPTRPGGRSAGCRTKAPSAWTWR